MPEAPDRSDRDCHAKIAYHRENLQVELDMAHPASLAAFPKTALAEIICDAIAADVKVVRWTVDDTSLDSV